MSYLAEAKTLSLHKEAEREKNEWRKEFGRDSLELKLNYQIETLRDEELLWKKKTENCRSKTKLSSLQMS